MKQCSVAQLKSKAGEVNPDLNLDEILLLKDVKNGGACSPKKEQVSNYPFGLKKTNSHAV